LDLVGANAGRVGDLAMGDLNVAFSFEMGNISQRRLSLAFDEPPPCISPCSLINGSESTQISRWIQDTVAPAIPLKEMAMEEDKMGRS